MAKGKVPNEAKVSTIAQHTARGIPSEFVYGELITMFDPEQKKYNDSK